jgi:hypothetical protein
MTMQVTNKTRADWALDAVSVFQNETGTERCDAIADLIADLCHLAKRWKQDPLEQVRRGLIMYADERDYPPDGWAPTDQLADVTVCIYRNIARKDR